MLHYEEAYASLIYFYLTILMCAKVNALGLIKCFKLMQMLATEQELRDENSKINNNNNQGEGKK